MMVSTCPSRLLKAAIQRRLRLLRERLGEVIALAEGVRRLAPEGSMQMVVNESFLRRAADEGLRIRQYSVPPGGSVQCIVSAEDDLLIGHMAADLTGARRVDLCLCDEGGAEFLRLADIPFAPGWCRWTRPRVNG